MARLELRHDADQDWPYDFVATLNILLAEDVLSQQLTIWNTDKRRMPAGLGFHPYFPVDDGTGLQANWHGVWETSPDYIPVEHRPLAQRGAILPARWTVNHCFTGWDRQAVLVYDQHTVTLQGGANCGFVQCYQPGPGSGFIAIEPVTHVPNAHHIETALPGETGLRYLEPNESLATTMSMAAAIRP
jgi:aldose 1-epimerase